MNKVKSCLQAGFTATVVLSVLMVIKSMMGLMPQFNVIRDIAGMFGVSPHMAWVIHFILGTVVWGLAFCVLVDNMKGPFWLRGLIFGVAAWIGMMLFFMPLSGHGLFAMSLGMPVLVATLLLHMIYGINLGMVYTILRKREAS